MSLKVSLYESYICASMNKNVLLEWSKHHELPSKDGLRVPFKFKQWKLFQKLRIGGFKKVISYGLFELFFGSTNPISYTKNPLTPQFFFLDYHFRTHKQSKSPLNRCLSIKKKIPDQKILDPIYLKIRFLEILNLKPAANQNRSSQYKLQW